MENVTGMATFSGLTGVLWGLAPTAFLLIVTDSLLTRGTPRSWRLLPGLPCGSHVSSRPGRSGPSARPEKRDREKPFVKDYAPSLSYSG